MSLCDVVFEEGGIEIPEEFRTTLGLIEFDFPIPKFTIEMKGLTDRYFNLAMHKDIDYILYDDFSEKFLVKVENIAEMKRFLTEDIKNLITDSAVVHHLECNGDAILLFTDNLRLARVNDFHEIAGFARDLYQLVNRRRN